MIVPRSALPRIRADARAAVRPASSGPCPIVCPLAVQDRGIPGHDTDPLAVEISTGGYAQPPDVRRILAMPGPRVRAIAIPTAQGDGMTTERSSLPQSGRPVLRGLLDLRPSIGAEPSIAPGDDAVARGLAVAKVYAFASVDFPGAAESLIFDQSRNYDGGRVHHRSRQQHAPDRLHFHQRDLRDSPGSELDLEPRDGHQCVWSDRRGLPGPGKCAPRLREHWRRVQQCRLPRRQRD